MDLAYGRKIVVLFDASDVGASSCIWILNSIISAQFCAAITLSARALAASYFQNLEIDQKRSRAFFSEAPRLLPKVHHRTYHFGIWWFRSICPEESG